MNKVTVPLSLVFCAAALSAQPKATLDCNHDNNGGNRAHFCEMREQAGPAGSMLSVDARQNGGISIKGWDRADVLVRAQVRTEAPTDGEAQNLARQINVQATGPQVRAFGPQNQRDQSWSVSYEIFVPSRFSVNLETVNGGVSISDVSGNLEFTTVNGGLSLHRVGGNVRGRTTNGGVSVELAGDRWDGQGLDVTTTNGGVNLRVPRNYSAQLEAQTQNGGISAREMPEVLTQTPDGRRSTHISTSLGAGGAPLKITTTNGGVSLTRI